MHSSSGRRGGLFWLGGSGSRRGRTVALSDGVCDQASGAQLSSAATAIAVLWKKRSGALTFLGPTAEFMKHLGLAGHAHQAWRKPQRATVSPIGTRRAAFFPVGSWRRELKRGVERDGADRQAIVPPLPRRRPGASRAGHAQAEFANAEVTAVIGRSGSGKSTLLNLISGIDRPDSGSVEIDGLDVTALTEPRLTLFRRKNIGFVYQFFNLVPTLDVEENVRLVLELNGVRGAEARQRSLAILREVGLEDRARSAVDTLSGGEQQRVAIARALVHRPPVLLADERPVTLTKRPRDRCCRSCCHSPGNAAQRC